MPFHWLSRNSGRRDAESSMQTATVPDSRTFAHESLILLRTELDHADVDYLVFPPSLGERATVAVTAKSLSNLYAALQRLDHTWFVADGTNGVRTFPPLSRWAAETTSFSSVVTYRSQHAPGGRAFGRSAYGLVLQVWEVVGEEGAPRQDGGRHAPGTLVAPDSSTSVSYLSAEAWRHACGRGRAWHLPHPHAFQLTEPVDAVYTWVDGEDQDWQERKHAALNGADTTDLHKSAIADARFLPLDELRYSLRSIEMFASWVRHIFIVTDRQTPAWLNTSHPKISIVDHREIFRDPSALPVFNSHAIGSQLHHIPGLADRYIYLNDDVFLGRQVAPELFFDANGLTRFFPANLRIPWGPPANDDLPVVAAAKQGRALIETEFGRTVTHRFKHAPHPQSRPILEQLERQFPDEFARTEHSRFRHYTDISAVTLSHYVGYLTGRAVPGEIASGYIDVASERLEGFLEHLERVRDLDAFCINTVLRAPGAHERKVVADFLERYFPFQSAFEQP